MKLRNAMIIVAAIVCLLAADGWAKSKKARAVRPAMPPTVQVEGWSIEREPRPQASREEAEYECGEIGKSLAPLGVLMMASDQNLIQADPRNEWSETNIDGFVYPGEQKNATIKNGGSRRLRPYRCAVQISVSM